MAQTKEDLEELFAEGVEYTIQQGWVSPQDIHDPALAADFEALDKAYVEFKRLAVDFQEKLDGWQGE